MNPMRTPRLFGHHMVAAVAATALAGVLMPFATAQDGSQPVTFTLYRGEGDSGNIALSSWGSGKAEPTTENVLLGDAAIKVTTHGMYQGGRIDFKSPVDLAAAIANGRTYLRMMARFNTSSGSNVGGFPGGGNPGSGGGFPGGNGGDGGGFSSTGSLANTAPFERMRFIAVMANGDRYELVRPLDMKPTEDPDAYLPVSLPIASIFKSAKKRISGDGAKLKSFVICGDKYQQFQIGEIQVVTDDTDISVNPLEDQIAFINNDVVFSGDAEAGDSNLKFSWDWDARDGIQEDTVGRSVTKVFTRAGKYVITLTVSDVDGLKKPQSVKQELDVAN